VFVRFIQVTGSKLLSSGFAFVFGVALARMLGPEQYGLLALSFGVTAVIAEVTGYGLETALVRSATRFLQAGRRDRAAASCSFVFWVKLLVNSAFLVVGTAAAAPVAARLGNPAYALPIQMGLAAGLGLSMWRLSLAILQALERFGAYAVVQTSSNAIKLAALAGLVLLGRLTLGSALLVHVASFFAGCLLGLWRCPRDLLRFTPFHEPGIWRPILHFSKWIVPASLFAISNTWLGVLVLSFFTQPRAVGEFAAAQTVIGAFDILSVSLCTILLPAAFRISDRTSGIAFVKRGLSASGCLSLALLPLYVIAPGLFAALYSAAFERAAEVFRVLFWGFLVTLNVEPLVLVLYARNRTLIVAGLEFSKLQTALIASLLLVPVFSLTGAAIALVLGRLVGGVLGLGAVYAVLRARPDAEASGAWASPGARPGETL